MKTSALLLSLALVFSCASPPNPATLSLPPSLVMTPASAQAPPQMPAEQAILSAPENRDLHGPRDTQRYIAMLSDTDRVKQLKPALVAQKIKARLDLPTDAIIADVGCGPGVFEWSFSAIVPDGFVLAADVEPAQLDALRSGLLQRGIKNVVPVLASYESPHLPPGRCDVVFIADTYHHLENRVAYLANLRQSLTATGTLVLLEFKDGEIPIGPPSSHKIPLSTRHTELKAAGFEFVESLGTHIWQDLEIWRRARVAR